jgi:hypothetical protein
MIDEYTKLNSINGQPIRGNMQVESPLNRNHVLLAVFVQNFERHFTTHKYNEHPRDEI